MVFVLGAVVVISPLVLALGSRKDKKTKKWLKYIFLALLILQLVFGFFNWERFDGEGRSGFELARSYPSSLLFLFFGTALFQILLLFITRRAGRVCVSLNFFNTVLIFWGMVRISEVVGHQVVSLAGTRTVFLVLIGNVVGLIYINQDPKLLAKWPWSKNKT